jgi:hypothetical protein
VIIGEGSESSPLEFIPDPIVIEESILDRPVYIASAVLPNFHFEARDLTLSFQIPSTILPLSLAVVNDFHRSPILLDLELELTTNSLSERARVVHCMNPIFGPSFAARALVIERVNRFFTKTYRPQRSYRCVSYVLEPIGNVRDHELAVLIDEGFDYARASRALILSHNRIKDARDFLLTGAMDFQPPELSIEYSDCPILWLIFEVCEAFFDLESHCCICGTDLKIAGVKASLCSNPVCLFAFRDIGLGSSVVVELRRDLAVTDLILSLASVSASPFAAWAGNPTYAAMYKDSSAELPSTLLQAHPNFFGRLPPVHLMASCETDADLKRLVGGPEFEILRFIFLSLRAQLFSLPDKMKLRECAEQTDQFFVAMSSPEKELAFRQKKQTHGAHYLWHGSPVTNWLSILQNGLGLSSQGIVWHASMSTVSFGYSGKGGQIANKYTNSRWKGPLMAIGFVESVKGEGLQGAVPVFTQRDLGGLALRVLMIIRNQYTWDTVTTPPKYMPTEQEVLAHIAKESILR